MESSVESAFSKKTTDHVSVVRLAEQWFVVCLASELRHEPLGRMLQGVPLVLFRDETGKPAALLDRCPHRNAPLSEGRTRKGLIECAYHGWQFDGAGECRAIPGYHGETRANARRASSHAAIEQDGFIWVFSTPGRQPRGGPFRFPHLGERGYVTVRQVFEVESTLRAALENALDVPHTAFLHGGLFRTTKEPREIEVVVRRAEDRAEAEFIGEPRPAGLVGRLLAPAGGVVTHFDRFFLPSIAQVEYRLGGSHLMITTAMTPVSEFVTRLFALASFRLPIPAWIAKPFLTPIGTRIFRQDANVLSSQTRNIRRFGGEHFSSTEIDLLGPHIWHLLKQAERGVRAEASLGAGGSLERDLASLESESKVDGTEQGETRGAAKLHEHRVRLTI